MPAILDVFLEGEEEDVTNYLRDTLPDYVIDWNENKMFARAKERNLAGFVRINID